MQQSVAPMTQTARLAFKKYNQFKFKDLTIKLKKPQNKTCATIVIAIILSHNLMAATVNTKLNCAEAG